MKPDAYTPQEDAAILAGVASGTPYRRIAAELGRSRSGVMARAVALDRPPAARKRRPAARNGGRHARHWTAAEDDYLRAWLGVRSDRAVAAALGRTVVACDGRARRLGHRRGANSLTVAAVGRVFGVPKTTVRHWVKRGWLAAVKRPVRQGAGRLWHVPDAALRRFVRERLHPRDVGRMRPDHWLTALARERVAGEEWLTLKEAAGVVHYSPAAMWRWAATGELAGSDRLRRGRDTPLVVRRRDLLAAAARHEALVRARMSDANRRPSPAAGGGA